MVGTADLGERLAEAIHPHVETLSGPETRDATNAVVAVFAGWARERAETFYAFSRRSSLNLGQRWSAYERGQQYEAFADEIVRKGSLVMDLAAIGADLRAKGSDGE